MKKSYQLLKQKLSLCSISRHINSKLLSNWLLSFNYFSRDTGFCNQFREGNFRGRLPGTSALGMLLRLNEVKFSPAKNVSLIVARPRDISKFKMAAIPP